MITAVYIRKSTETQKFDSQEHDLRGYCIKKGYRISEIYQDTISGKEKSRPAFDKMFVDARKRKFDLVLFWALDRFSRAGTLYTMQKLKELENLGIKWESFSEPYFNSLGEFKDVVLAVMATLAKVERERRSERTIAGLRASKKKHLIGKRGKDRRPRKRRDDRGLKRIKKDHQKNVIINKENQPPKLNN